ncbi:MAG: glutamine amidotransferase, partial [Verrucomicrobiales bacterium]|nr:glutamine amidotransferase [Verrucomicrobiales bacterium]
PNQAPTKLTLTLRTSGFDQKSVPIQVRQKERIVAVQEVKLTGREQQIELEFTPQEKGFQKFEVSLPVQNGEWLASNNRRLFGLDVIDPSVRVLYLEGTPQQPNVSIPEWDYLNDALESDKDIKVKVLVRIKGATGRRLRPGKSDPDTGESVYPIEHATRGFPKTMDELLKYDVVIHSDIRKESFTAEQLQNIARLVEEYGGGFVMIGGASAFGKGGYHQTILDRIIPVAMERSSDAETRLVQWQIPQRAWQHPLIALGATREETQAIWTTKFPRLYGCNLVDHAKPGATVLGHDATRRNAYGPVLLMAVQEMGRGRSMAFMSDTTRTWGRDFETLWGEPIDAALPRSETNCDSRYYRQFWVNAVRWLAAAKIGKTNSAVTLELAQSYATPEEKVMASVKVRDQQMREITSADVSVVLSAPGKSSVSFTAAYDSARRAYLAQVLPGTSADYTITAIAAQKGQRLGQDQQLLVCEDVDREMAEVRANPHLLARLARLSGGRSFTTMDTDLSSISSAFSNKPEATVEYKRFPLWDRAWLLATVLALLATEWASRRWKGLA